MNAAITFWYTLQSGHGLGPESSDKADPRHLEKVDPIPKLTVWVKGAFMINSKVLISNMTIAL